jgi:hypothetical protein
MATNKLIPVSEDTWKGLERLRAAGMTYDELLLDLIQAYNRQELVKKARKARTMDSDVVESINGIRG